MTTREIEARYDELMAMKKRELFVMCQEQADTHQVIGCTERDTKDTMIGFLYSCASRFAKYGKVAID